MTQAAAASWDDVWLLDGVRTLAGEGFVTGASGRNWDGYGADVAVPEAFSAVERALLTDPQTSGGLLVSCAPQAADEVLAIFHREGFADAAVIGRMEAHGGAALRVEVGVRA